MDSDGVEMVPAKAGRGKQSVKGPQELKNVEEEDDSEVDEEDEGSEGEEYRVEKILKHDFTEDRVTLYQIKWLGYDKKSDLTWEPVENLYVAEAPSPMQHTWS
jgi:chromobox protein 1